MSANMLVSGTESIVLYLWMVLIGQVEEMHEVNRNKHR